jgi:VCBS repeat protein
MILNAYIRPIVLIALLVGVMSLSLLSASAQSATFLRTDYPFLGNNNTVADFNADGIPDLAGCGTNSASIMLGNSNGTFRPKVQYPTGGTSQDLAAGDFNSDGRVDLVVSINEPNISLSLLTGNGDGTFNAPVSFPNTSGFDSPAIVATDLDNDTRLDVVLAHTITCRTAPCVVGRTITVLLGVGDGTFQPPWEMEVGTGMSRIAVGDFNQDRIKDLAIAGSSSRLYLLLGVGNGTFLQQPTITMTADTFGVDATDVDVADFNRDTLPDLVVALPLNGSRTAILLGNGDGTFRTPSIITEPHQRAPQYQVVADFNRDGFEDIAIALGWGLEGHMEILNGNGDGTFRLPVLYLVPSTNTSTGGSTLVTGDFNSDGRPDIALPIIGASISLVGLINSTGAAPPPPVALGTVTASPSTITGGGTTQIAINLANGSVAPSGGLTFSVSSSNSTVLPVPSSVFMPAGSSSITFNATSRTVTSTQNITIQVRHNQLGRRSVVVTVTPSAPPPPPALSLVGLTLSPGTVTGGNSATGTVTLSATAPAATTVNLASNNTSAAVPATVTVPAGASSANFTITTVSVTATTSAIISATLNGVTRSATLTINPAGSTSDTVTITRAEFESSKGILRVEATSTRPDATLQVFVTASGQLLGTLSNNGGGQYRAELSVSTNPQNITVRSNFGGVATRTVIAR